MGSEYTVIYWDASAVLSVLFKDVHSRKARTKLEKSGIHLISTLSYSETCAVISRMNKEKHIEQHQVKTAHGILDSGMWRLVQRQPEAKTIRSVSNKTYLRGADLWHLAVAKDLKKEIPELLLLTFDTRLQKAAQKQGVDTHSTTP